MLIVPAILTNDEGQFVHQAGRLLPHFSLFQIDVQDGQYVPSTTLSLPSVVGCLAKLIVQFPEKMHAASFDLHLMLSDYSGASKELNGLSEDINIRYVFVHRNIEERIDTSPTSPFTPVGGIPLHKGGPSSGRSSFEGGAPPWAGWWMSQICPVLNPQDVDLLQEGATFLGQKVLSYPAIQIMTISPGPQGQAFEPANLDKIKTLRKNGYKGEILIDGSVNEKSIKLILEKEKVFWPDTLCVGSYLSRAPDSEVNPRTNALNELAKST